MATVDDRPLLLVPYTWIGDFVRCHTVVSVARARWPGRAIDVLSSSSCAPLAGYMPDVRQAIVWNLPHGRLTPVEQWRLARRLQAEGYGAALIMPRKWKAALAPFLAGIPVRTGMVGEARFGLVNDLRWNEKKLPRMIDRCAALALARDASLPEAWPPPRLRVPVDELSAWRARSGLAASERPVVALCPGAAGAGKAWPVARYAELAGRLRALGATVWVLGGLGEKAAAAEISRDGEFATDLTGDDLRQAVLALAAADAAVANDSGLLHVAAALGTPAVGLYGPTDPKLWAPLNPLAAAIEPLPSGTGDATGGPVRRTMRGIAVARVLAAVVNALDLPA